MLVPEQSPVHIVVAELEASHPRIIRGDATPSKWRARIYRAAADECDLMIQTGTHYDPGCDARVRWALEWVDILEGTRRFHTPHLPATKDFLSFKPASLSRKDSAAGETQTLAQGS